ncbi:uncharacterized protein TM35_000113540 [Trypanosoma theileri]|uniref:Uncharacterized protein n=1 Tax=Trypanosoma theileri TaxID=67003 RepID=A0A1X0P087_9TRYP|nr:uncharacterized protein TM35_000113540 [Trypanosoma theileri]ORC89820.1 hypothetical protein TM35_000113540 [Trypanosoma theileri]
MDDISSVVKNYYTVIGQKDDDIFELYRDNKHLKQQLSELRTGEEERETERRTLKLLVVALQTEVREKQALIEAHQLENTAFRKAIYQAREVLHMPSEFDHTPEDVINTFINIHTKYSDLCGRQTELTKVINNVYSDMCRMLLEEEEKQRHAIIDACNSTHLVFVRLSQYTREVILEKQHMREKYEETERKYSHEAELSAKRMQVEHRQQERLMEEWREKITFTNSRVMQLEGQVRSEQAEKELLLEAACSRLDLMVERCSDLERVLLMIFRTVGRCTKELQNTQTEKSSLQLKIDKLQRNLSRVRSQLRLNHQPSSLNTSNAKDGVHGMVSLSVDQHEAFLVLQKEHEALKVEWRNCVERERTLRQQTTTSIKKIKTERDSFKATAAESQRRCSVLDEALQRTRAEVKQLTNQVKQQQELQQALSKEVERDAVCIRSLEGCKRTLEEEKTVLTTRLNTLQELHDSQFQQHQQYIKEKEEMWAAAERAACEHISSLEQQLDYEKAGFLHELQEWTQALDDMRSKLAAAESERDREKMLRGMLQEQCREEENLLRNLMTDDHKATIEALQAKVNMLESACKRSAVVIAELREATHRNT